MKSNRMSPEAEASPAKIRSMLLDTAAKLTARRDDAEHILLQCADYFRSRHLLQCYAQEGGLTLGNSYTNDEMQIYYEIWRNGDRRGFISKGWEEPYYRLGQILRVPEKNLLELQQHSQDVMLYLATNGIAITAERDKKTGIHYMNLTINIPEAGFNKDTFSQAVETMSTCVQQLRQAIPCE